jgi:hypothetical protein
LLYKDETPGPVPTRLTLAQEGRYQAIHHNGYKIRIWLRLKVGVSAFRSDGSIPVKGFRDVGKQLPVQASTTADRRRQIHGPGIPRNSGDTRHDTDARRHRRQERRAKVTESGRGDRFVQLSFPESLPIAQSMDQNRSTNAEPQSLDVWNTLLDWDESLRESEFQGKPHARRQCASYSL